MTYRPLRGVEDAAGLQNDRVLTALWVGEGDSFASA